MGIKQCPVESVVNMNKGFWKGKNVLITGHTGFKGSWLSIILKELGANITGYALDPLNDADNYNVTNISSCLTDIRGDIRNFPNLLKVFEASKPDIVFHLAAQPLVRFSYDEPRYTYDVNVMGTLNVLECIRKVPVAAAIMVTTDKCYENKEQIWGYREDDKLGGIDPYSSSKACAEILVSSYRDSFLKNENIPVASVRAGNVIGGGDWAVDRIIPDCIRAIEQDVPIKIRNPKSVRPFQHVLEPLFGYILLAEKLCEKGMDFAKAWNFGPLQDSFVNVWEVGELFVKSFKKGQLIDVSENDAPHEAALLYLDSTMSRHYLGWKPLLDMNLTIELTADWYKSYKNNDMYSLCKAQIERYFELMQNM